MQTKALKKMRIKEGMVENRSFASRIVDAVIILLVLCVLFCSIIPLWHVIMSSISDGKTLLAQEGLVIWPVGTPTLGGYANLFQDASILKGYGNTLLYVVGATFFCMVINVTGGYVISRPSKLQGVFLLFVMITAMFGGGLIPTYMVVKDLGWVGTRWSLLIPGCTNAFFMVTMVAAYRSVPEATIEAARIDGAGHLRIMFNIMLPQAMSMGIIIVLNSVILQWNSWFNASIYVPTQTDAWPLQLWIKQILADNANFLRSTNPDYSKYLIQYAVIVISTLPILIAMPFFAEKMEKNVVVGAVKG